MATGRLTIRLPEKLESELESLVVATGRSESDLVREAIERFIRSHARMPTAADLARKAGIIGCIDSGVGDLSTNPDHMEGFGRE